LFQLCAKFTAGVLDTCGKIAASTVDTGGKNDISGIGIGAVNTGGKFVVDTDGKFYAGVATPVIDTGGAP
jgi:hypothetical protein